MDDLKPTADVAGLVERLRARSVRVLPADWQKGRECPECGSCADRPKCAFELGASCPRHDPSNYEPSPFVTKPDRICTEAATTLEALSAENARLREEVRRWKATSDDHFRNAERLARSLTRSQSHD